jgi:hypothetical protein
MPLDALRKHILWRVSRDCQSLSASCPRVYLLLAATCALAGYLYLLLFPWLVVASALGIYKAVNNGNSVVWDLVIIWLLVGALSALVSYRIFTFRPVLPDGKVLDRKKHPILFQLVADLSRHYHNPCVDRIVLSSIRTARVVKKYTRGRPATAAMSVGTTVSMRSGAPAGSVLEALQSAGKLAVSTT